VSADNDREKRVRVVANLFELVVKPPMPSFEVKRKIEAALQGKPGLEAVHISVSAKGDAVTLSGHVKTWHEREAAEQAALSVSGVTGVTDHLRVES